MCALVMLANRYRFRLWKNRRILQWPSNRVRTFQYDVYPLNTTYHDRSTAHRIVRSLKFRAYHPRLLHALSEDDPDRRLEFCEHFCFQAREDRDFVDAILWTDEAKFYLNGQVNRHNCIYWATENPHRVVTQELNSPSFMVWAGICSNGIFGPFFIDEGTVNGQVYLNLLQERVMPEKV